MSYGIWLSAAGLQTNEYRQTVAANNIANVDTVGFKRDLAVMHQRQMASEVDPVQRRFTHPMLDAMGGGVWVQPTVTQFDQGDLETTDKPLDTAIAGDGFFTVSDGDQTRYTRDGRFTRNAAGEMVSVASDGRFRAVDQAGQPIVIAPTVETVNIARDGTVFADGAPLARLGVVDFADRTLLRKTGGNAFAYDGDGGTIPATGDVIAGTVERSTVDPAVGLTELIEVARAYELNGRMITIQDQTLELAVNRVGRIG